MQRAAHLATTLMLASVACAVPAASVTQLNAVVTEPRAFGYSVGDRVERTAIVDVPSGLRLDTEALPPIGRQGHPLELRQITWQPLTRFDHEHYRMRLEYQVFLSPREARTLEMPPVILHFIGKPRDQDLRIDAWPVSVSPLVPIEASPRNGLGELRPDWQAPLLDVKAHQRRLAAYAGLALLLLAYLALVYAGLPWWSARHRPFGIAWRSLRGLPASAPAERWRDALRTVHEALNRSAGQALFERDVDAFVLAEPRFAPLRDEIGAFFRRSRDALFAADASGAFDARWLVDFCRKCRDAERGAA